MTSPIAGHAARVPRCLVHVPNPVGRAGPRARCMPHTALPGTRSSCVSLCTSRRQRCSLRSAALGEEGPPWTPDQLAGLAFGVFLLLAVYFAKQVDVIVARSQRKQLGLCEECGGLFDPATCTEWRCPKRSN